MDNSSASRDAVAYMMKEERAVCAPVETMAADGLTQLPPPPAVLSPAPSTTMSPPLSEPDHRAEHGGRLKFFGKDGRVVLELSHSSDTFEKRWVAVARKTYWTPPTVNARMEQVASFSDDCSSVQSSPWPVDPYRRKQGAPRRRSSSGGTLQQLGCPPALALWQAAAGRARLRRLSRKPTLAAFRPPPLSPPPVAERRPRRKQSPLPAAGRAATLESLVGRLADRRRRPVVRPTQTVRIRTGKAGPSAWQTSPRKRPHAGRETGAARSTRPSPGPSTSSSAAGAGLSSPGTLPGSAAAPTVAVSPAASEPREPPQRNGRGTAPCSAYSIDSLLAAPSARSPARPSPRPPTAPPAPPPASEPPAPPPPTSAPSSAPPPHSVAASGAFSPLACHQSRYMQYLQAVSAFRGLEHLVPAAPPLPAAYPAYPLVSPLLYSQLSHPTVHRPAPLLARPASPPPPPPPPPRSAAARHQLPSPAHQASLHSPVVAAALQPEQDAPLNLSRR
ncbi:ras-associated and pleckstrin homology domains-containing protein 1-like isoform X1 [Amphibalanus amphitrite]|uniref:ras-associated and pleckstrin homology domains-containing protein 1-like isoform X1 n=2 Tax=Amphibalanus amphitrite TaxID=1232801 RepID=UPI001C91DCD5|nr:ras-associated and pleckstrin homology domains-containing protein 1-like isoform X1 [Amphibalanus amphitrite]